VVERIGVRFDASIRIVAEVPVFAATIGVLGDPVGVIGKCVGIVRAVQCGPGNRAQISGAVEGEAPRSI
jgi:hypothetical protein